MKLIKFEPKLIFFLIAISLILSYEVKSEELSLQEILDGISFNDLKVKGLKATLRYNHVMIESAKTQYKEKAEKAGRQWHGHTAEEVCDISYAIKNEKYKYDISSTKLTLGGKEIKKIKKIIYDGETFTEIITDLEGTAATLSTEEDVHRAEYSGAYSSFSPLFWGWGVNNKLLGEIIKSSKPKLLGTEELNGTKTYILGIKVGNMTTESKIWISPEQGFRYVKFQLILNGKGIEQINKLKEYPEEIWLPERGTRVTFSIDDQTGERKIQGKTAVKIENIEINPDIPDSSFEPNFEKGTQVFGTRTGESYTVE